MRVPVASEVGRKAWVLGLVLHSDQQEPPVLGDCTLLTNDSVKVCVCEFEGGKIHKLDLQCRVRNTIGV